MAWVPWREGYKPIEPQKIAMPFLSRTTAFVIPCETDNEGAFNIAPPFPLYTPALTG